MAAAVKNCAIIKQNGTEIQLQKICPKCGNVTRETRYSHYGEGKTIVFTETCTNPRCSERFEVRLIS